jgi:hypothetical protein
VSDAIFESFRTVARMKKQIASLELRDDKSGKGASTRRSCKSGGDIGFAWESPAGNLVATSHTVVDEAVGGHRLGTIKISAIHNDGTLHDFAEAR